ncbi:MAG TPA: NAD-dependent epimerase/dehydratase family protein [Pyrinomonadaceae bacterium]|jgi:UDP-glucose 4-epimerase
MKRIALVTGAGGAIGSILVRRLLEHGCRVRALVRGPSSRGLPETVEIFRGDITDSGLLAEATDGVGWVFHLAARLHLNNPPPGMQEEYGLANVEGTRRLVQAARGSGVERLIFFSTINVYGQTRPGEVFDEDSPLRPESLYAETKVRGERLALDGMASVVLRLAAVYGPGMKGNYTRLLQALRRGRVLMPGDGCNRRTLAFVEDVCCAAILAAEHASAAGQIYNVTDGQVHTLREIINAMSEALGRPVTAIRLPKSAVRLAAGVWEDGWRLAGKSSSVGRATVDKFVEDVAVSGVKIQQLGFRPQYDLRAGWRATVKEYLAERRLS